MHNRLVPTSVSMIRAPRQQVQRIFSFLCKSHSLSRKVFLALLITCLLVFCLYLPVATFFVITDIPLEDNSKAPADLLRSRFLASMPKCAAQGRAKTFLMVFMGHSGSTAITTSLQQHSDTLVVLEPVDHGLYLDGPATSTVHKALQYTEAFFANATQQSKTGGFKIRPRHLLANPAAFKLLLSRFDTRIIWSFRSNVMKQALGDYTTKYLGDKSAFEGLMRDKDGNPIDTEHRKTTFRIHDMNYLHEILKLRMHGDRVTTKAVEQLSPDDCILPVSYESYLRWPEHTLARVQTFLGLGLKEMHPPLRAKATEDSICDLVENWEQLCETFYGCPTWRWMLDDFESGCMCATLKPSKFLQSRKFCATAPIAVTSPATTSVGRNASLAQLQPSAQQQEAARAEPPAIPSQLASVSAQSGPLSSRPEAVSLHPAATPLQPAGVLLQPASGGSSD